MQIVAFDNPFPPDYGGTIDVFYKLKALHQMGIAVDLHYFVYGNRDETDPLYEYCENVFPYKRSMGISSFVSKTPFIVKSRAHKKLLENLSKKNSPVLFEGIHCTSFLDHPGLKNHFKIVRPHNIEHNYYAGLYRNTSGFFKKIYFLQESKKLNCYEPVLKHADLLLAISENDAKHFEKLSRTILIPPFSKSFSQVKNLKNYILYHGNLAVEENIRAVLELTSRVFSKIDLPVVIAGKSPPKNLEEAVSDFKNIRLISNPDSEEMDRLITEAGCHIFYTNQNTGVKLKLVHAIQTSGHIVMNSRMLFNPEYKDELEVADSWEEMIVLLQKCFSSREVKPRNRLRALFNNLENAKRIISEIPDKE